MPFPLFPARSFAVRDHLQSSLGTISGLEIICGAVQKPFAKIQKFMLVNFSALYAANRDEILNMSSKDIKIFTSSEEMNVCIEENVFNLILSWIDHEKCKRKQ